MLDEQNHPLPSDRVKVTINGVDYARMGDVSGGGSSAEGAGEGKESGSAGSSRGAEDGGKEKRRNIVEEIYVPYLGRETTAQMIVTVLPESSSSSGADGEAGHGAASGAGDSESESGTWSFSSLHQLHMYKEEYDMECGWHVDRQQLVRDSRHAAVAIRPRVFLKSGAARLVAVPLERVKDWKVVVESRDVDGS